MDSSLSIKIVEQPQQQNHHQQQTLQQPQQHPQSNIINNNNIDITNHTTVGVGTGEHLGGSNVILLSNERVNATYPNPIKRPPQPPQDPLPASKTPSNSTAQSKTNSIQRNQPAPSNTPPQRNLAKISTTAKITTTTTTSTTTKTITSQDAAAVGATTPLTTDHIDSFFARGLHNSHQATDELIKGIAESRDESLARKVLYHYQSHYSTLERPWEHETFMYGLGLIYMHFSAYNWAVKSLRNTVYVKPGFSRSRDIHTRLGLIFKSTRRYRLSEKHFNLAIHDTRKDSGTSTKLELRFHLAHLTELQGKTQKAIELYEKLLQEKDLPDKLSANIHRNLGWLHYTTISASSNSSCVSNNPQESRRPHYNVFNQNSLFEPQKLDSALNHLQTSNKTDSDSLTAYYLGRCLTDIGKFQDAFAFYRSVIDKEESTADTWCSIGVLYQRQNQPWDALQAYIRSVQYDKKHAVAWMNLGILYETHHQFKDALKCYRHVSRSNSTSLKDAALQARINYLQKHLADIEASLSSSGKLDISSDRLLNLEDLWNMESKTNQESYSLGSSNINKSDASNRQLTTSSAPLLTKATANHQSNQHGTQNDMTTPMEIDHPRLCNGQSVDQGSHSATNTTTQRLDSESTKSTAATNHPNVSNSVSEKFQTSQDQHNDRKPLTNHINGLPTSIPDDCKPLVATQVSHDIKPLHLEFRDTCLNQIFTNGASKDSGISSDSSTYADCALVPSQKTDASTASYVSAQKVLETCNEISTTKLKKIDINLLSDDSKLPSSCPKPPLYPPLPTNALLPLPPSIFLDTKKELASKKLQDICLANPISIVRNMANVLKLDLGLFSTRSLVESDPDQQIDIIGHLYSQDNESGIKGDESTNSWLCERHQSTSTISRYASYQVSSFRQSLQDELDGKSKTQMTKESETDSNESDANKRNSADDPGPSNVKSSPANKLKPRKDCQSKKFVKSANMIDLSDDKIWRPQIHELNKLPHFLKCVSASNMLTHIGSAVPGLNTIMMGMHVPGCKIVSNRMPSQFCSVHINTGPGDYEWCAVSAEYESVLRKVCNRNGLDLDQNDWWPLLSDLKKYRIPVYRFAQRPGDLVWINSSTLYWVQATGWANSIQWNLGPLCARQYQLALENCELNKYLFKPSEVPLIQMTWNIIMNISIITDDELFQSMANVLRRSLRYCKLVTELIKESNKTVVIQSHDEKGPRAAKNCALCEVEIFNISFESMQPDKPIHCVECARRTDGTFSCYKIKQEYELSYLMEIYDNFIDMKKRFQRKQMQVRGKGHAKQ